MAIGAALGFSPPAQPVRRKAAASAAPTTLFDTMHPLLERPGQQEQDDTGTDGDPGNRREGPRVGIEADLKVGDLPTDRLDASELSDDSREVLRDRYRQEPDPHHQAHDPGDRQLGDHAQSD